MDSCSRSAWRLRIDPKSFAYESLVEFRRRVSEGIRRQLPNSERVVGDTSLRFVRPGCWGTCLGQASHKEQTSAAIMPLFGKGLEQVFYGTHDGTEN
jgi:hypothetical protein